MDENPEEKLVYCEVFPPDIIKLYNTNLLQVLPCEICLKRRTNIFLD